MHSQAVRIKIDAQPYRLTATASAVFIVIASQSNPSPDSRYQFGESVSLNDAISIVFDRYTTEVIPLGDAMVAKGFFARAEAVALADAVSEKGVMALAYAVALVDTTAASFTAVQADVVPVADAMTGKGVFVIAEPVSLADQVNVTLLVQMLHYARPGELMPGASQPGRAR